MRKNILISLIVLILVVAGVIWLIQTPNKSVQLDGFAQCLTDSGAKFYGAFWCSHCQNQKKMFGDSAKFMPYVECSTPNGREQLQVCAEANITGYPTWVFADGTREMGELSLEHLSEVTSCPLPNE